MEKETTIKTEALSAPVAAEQQPLSLDEFCRRLSMRDRRVELIGAFHAGEKKGSRIKDTEVAYAARFAKFVNQPA